jgi:myo-inositol-1(or 4)-monophosphatase
LLSPLFSSILSINKISLFHSSYRPIRPSYPLSKNMCTVEEQHFIKKISREAGEIVRKKYGKVGIKYTKGHASNIVTEADLKSEALLIGKIKEKYPDHGIISEEAGEYQVDAEYIWYIDPLDGSNNFVSQLPIFCVMISVAKNNVLEAGVILDPIHNQLYYAERGRGVTLNDVPVECSKKAEFADTLGYVSSRIFEDRIPLWHKLLERSKQGKFWVHAFGCVGIAAAHVASGSMDWLIGTKVHIWDYACPAIVLTESGCIVTNATGEPWQLGDKEFIAATPKLHSELLDVVQKN